MYKRQIVDDKRDMITLTEEAVLASCDRRDKHCMLHILRECKGHQCSVRLPAALDAQYPIGLFMCQLPDALAYSRVCRCRWTLRHVTTFEKRFIGMIHCIAVSLLPEATAVFVMVQPPVERGPVDLSLRGLPSYAKCISIGRKPAWVADMSPLKVPQQPETQVKVLDTTPLNCAQARSPRELLCIDPVVGRQSMYNSYTI